MILIKEEDIEVYESPAGDGAAMFESTWYKSLEMANQVKQVGQNS